MLANEEASMPDPFPESHVVKMWQSCLPGRVDLLTEDGEPIKVIYPGRLNSDRGADLRDAVIATSRGLIRGDVEVHVKSSSWWAHRHHQDPVYNRVILHAVFRHDTDTAVNLQNGQTVPTLVLPNFLENQAGQPAVSTYAADWSMPCRNARDSRIIGRILDVAGEERFRARVTDFRTALAQTEPGQSLYQGIMGALGYTKNKDPLVELACRMPLRRLESVASVKTSDAECLAQQQSRLMGMAGLLPSQRSRRDGAYQRYDEWVEKLEEAWASSRETAAMSEDDWHLFKVRPGNFPTRRIAAMSYLLLRYREKGILAGLVNRLCRATADTGYSGLEGSFRVTADGYWARNLDFGLPGRGGVPALIGGGRAAGIVVNVLLPFAAAWGRVNSRMELPGKALEVYRRHPALPVNSLERHMMSQLGTGRYLVDSAQRQQGLIHIYKTLCSQGKCRDCPLGN